MKLVCAICQVKKSDRNFNKVKINPVHPKGYLPVCKSCVNKLLFFYYKKYDYHLGKATEKLCQLLDLYYNSSIVMSAWKHCGKEMDYFWGQYIQRLALMQYKKKVDYNQSAESHFFKRMIY